MNDAFVHLDNILTIMEYVIPTENIRRNITPLRRAIEKDTACVRTLIKKRKNKVVLN